jgi:hypothetical protein
VFMTTIQGQSHLLFRNNVGQDHGWLRVAVEGGPSLGRDAFAAVVRVRTSAGVLTKTKAGGSGYISSTTRDCSSASGRPGGRGRRGHVAGRHGRALSRALRGGNERPPRPGPRPGRDPGPLDHPPARPPHTRGGDRVRAARQGGPARARSPGREPRRPQRIPPRPAEAGPPPPCQRLGDLVRPLPDGDA